MNKHILVVSQYFYPEPFRINDICTELVKRGNKVTVITGIPNYPEGRFYKGYGLTKRRKERWNGIDIVRLPIISRGHSAVRLIANYYSFVISGTIRNLFKKEKIDAVFTFEVSPLTQALVGVRTAKKAKVPHFLYVQDLWPDNLDIVGGIHSKSVLAHYDKMAKKIYKRSYKIFATSDSFVEEIRNRITENGGKTKDFADVNKVVYLPQYAEDVYKPYEAETEKRKGFSVVFTGNIGEAQGLDVLPRTAKILKEQGHADVKFVIVGDGRHLNDFIGEIKAAGAEDMFELTGRKPQEEIPKIFASCDVAFVSFKNNELFAKTIPAKLQSYMACRMPVLASATGETKRIIEEADCGICCPAGDEQSLANAVIELKNSDKLKEYGKNAEKYYKEHFDKNSLLNILDKYLCGESE